MMNRRDFLIAAGMAAGGAYGKTSSMTISQEVREGHASVPGGRVWWRVVGNNNKTPLLVLHGGPGMGHDYLEPLGRLAHSRPVIFYDQLGCGRSDKPDDPSLYSIDHFSEEIDALLWVLKVEKVLLYGHAFGGWLALEYMARHGTEAPVEALILASASSSARQNMEGKRRLLREMPGNLEQRLIRIERSGLQNSRAYAAIVQSFSRAHLFDWAGAPPEIFIDSILHMEWSRSYPIMNGPNEFSITGNLRGWDRETSLKHIKVPTLVLTSEWDEVTMDSQVSLHRGIEHSQLVSIPKARHLAMIEKPTTYIHILQNFMAP
jgi:proline-specific peptidase